MGRYQESNMKTHVAKDHGLADGQHSVNVGDGLVFFLLAPTANVVLFDVVQ